MIRSANLTTPRRQWRFGGERRFDLARDRVAGQLGRLLLLDEPRGRSHHQRLLRFFFWRGAAGLAGQESPDTTVENQVRT